MPKRHDITDDYNKKIGARIREVRLSMGLTVANLTSMLDITHQQLCKYETGKNRISAGRLVHLARQMHKPITFFTDLEEPFLKYGKHDRMLLDIMRTIRSIKDKNKLKILVDMAHTFAEDKS